MMADDDDSNGCDVENGKGKLKWCLSPSSRKRCHLSARAHVRLIVGTRKSSLLLKLKWKTKRNGY
jgi:hypothetical protein